MAGEDKHRKSEERKATKTSSLLRGLSIAMLCLSLPACKVGPEFCRPSVSLPANWEVEPQVLSPENSNEISCWWKQLNSPELDLMIEQVVSCNLSVREALHRIEEARSMERVTAASNKPEVFGTGSSLYKQFSKNGNAFIPQGSAFPLNSMGFDASWEIDLWGKLKRLNEAAVADRIAYTEAYRDLIVSLTAETAKTFVEARTLQARLAIADRNLAIQSETVKLAESKQAAGLVTYLDVAQGRAEFHTTEASIPLLRQQLQQASLRLSVLQGAVPSLRSIEQLGGGPIPEVPFSLNFGIPQDLLRRRPDIRQAEQDLVRENARIGVATADLYPQLTLLGVISVDSRNIDSLFTGDSLAHSVGPSFRWNLLNFGRIRNKIAAQDQRYYQAVAKYRETILLAAEETLGAMISLREEQERRIALSNAAMASRQALEIAMEQYRTGLVNFQSVLDTQRQLLLTEESLASSQGQTVVHLIQTYKSIGGGWQCPGPVGESSSIDIAETPTAQAPIKIDENGTVLR
jgi:NodT family efflux transporter outer membrane factor (OMF) lipoprotein